MSPKTHKTGSQMKKMGNSEEVCRSWRTKVSNFGSDYKKLLVSGCGLACQQEISLVLAKTLPIHN